MQTSLSLYCVTINWFKTTLYELPSIIIAQFDTDEGVNCGLLIPQVLSVLAFEVIQRISV